MKGRIELNFGEYIKKLRTERHLSQRELAEISSISNAEISRLESGERKEPSPKVIRAIAVALGVSYMDLMIHAGYVDQAKTDGDLFKEIHGNFSNAYLKATHIAEQDEELIGIIDRIINEFSREEIEAMKKVLNMFLDDRVPDSDKLALLTILDRFAVL